MHACAHAMYACIHACNVICAFVYVCHACMCVYVCSACTCCMLRAMHACVYVMFVCMCACVFARMYVRYINVSTYVCMHLCV